MVEWVGDFLSCRWGSLFIDGQEEEHASHEKRGYQYADGSLGFHRMLSGFFACYRAKVWVRCIFSHQDEHLFTWYEKKGS